FSLFHHSTARPISLFSPDEKRPDLTLRIVGSMCYWGIASEEPWAFMIGGGFHFPVNASDFGAYSRMQRLNTPLGAGNQFASLFAPGLSFWKYRSSEPSALYLKGIQLLTANRFKGFAT